MTAVRYLVFDTESAADGQLVADLRYPGKQLSPADAVARYRAELMERYESDFIPYTFQFPVAVAIATVSAGYELIDLVSLDAPAYRPHVMTDLFWRGWDKYRKATLVSFNGRGFDIPLLELAALRYGLSIPAWYNVAARTFEQPRNRYNVEAHCDLQELLTNHGATRFTGGLNLVANLLGKPGKMDVQGCMVQDMYEQQRYEDINAYCRCDVLDTYFVFLRSRVLLGQLRIAEEQELIAATHNWLKERAASDRAMQIYLDHWGDWPNPWSEQP